MSLGKGRKEGGGIRGGVRARGHGRGSGEAGERVTEGTRQRRAGCAQVKKVEAQAKEADEATRLSEVQARSLRDQLTKSEHHALAVASTAAQLEERVVQLARQLDEMRERQARRHLPFIASRAPR